MWNFLDDFPELAEGFDAEEYFQDHFRKLPEGMQVLAIPRTKRRRKCCARFVFPLHFAFKKMAHTVPIVHVHEAIRHFVPETWWRGIPRDFCDG